MTTEEGNKLIAEFMKMQMGGGLGKLTVIHRGQYCSPKYHTSWDWLMPAWRKVINEIGIWMAVHEKPHYSKVWSEKCEQISRAISAVDIDSAFKEITVLIQWYNSQPKS